MQGVDVRISVVNYGMGNLLSVRRALEACGADVTVSDDPDVIASADRLVLPGVGAFGSGMDELNARGLVEAIHQFVATERPLLGICLGMQMLLTESSEHGNHQGLNLIPGQVLKIQEYDAGSDGVRARKIPHIGWSALKYPQGRTGWSGSVLENINEGEYFSFVHSYMAVPENLQDILAEYDCNGLNITAMVSKQNVMGSQFHPEKSGAAGLEILAAFLKL